MPTIPTTGKGIAAGLREYFKFQIFDDNIENRGREIYFLRIHPKNMSILSIDEKIMEIKKYQSFLDASGAHHSIFITDKTENLNEISHYYREQIELRPEYAFVLEPMLKRIMSIEKSSASVQRAFYIVLKVKSRREYEAIENQLAGRLDFSLAQKEELILLMRNYILREYTMFSLYVFEEAVKKHYEEYNRQARRNRHVEADPIHEAKEDNRIAIDRIAAAQELTERAEKSNQVRSTAIRRAVSLAFDDEAAADTTSPNAEEIHDARKPDVSYAAENVESAKKQVSSKRKTATPKRPIKATEKKAPASKPAEPVADAPKSPKAAKMPPRKRQTAIPNPMVEVNKPLPSKRKATATASKEKEVEPNNETVKSPKKAKNDGGSLWPQS